MVDTNKLKGLIISKYGNVKKYCEQVGFTESAMSRYLNNNRDISLNVADILIETLDIKDKDIKSIFFK